MNGKRVLAGILASLAGGVVFGLMMQMMGMIQMIAMMMGSQSTVAGWMVHLVISAIFGATWLAFSGPAGGAGRGLIYGAALWVFGPLLVMPAMVGMPMFAINTTAMISLVGHLVYGLVTGLAFKPLLGAVHQPPPRRLSREA